MQILDPTIGFGKESGVCVERDQYNKGDNPKEQRQDHGGMV